MGFPSGSDSKESTCKVGDLGLIPGLGRSPGGAHGNPLQYSCLENPIDRGARKVFCHRVTKSQMRLSDIFRRQEEKEQFSLLAPLSLFSMYVASLVTQIVKNPFDDAGDAGDVGKIPGWGRSPGGGHGNPLWYSCLENPKDRGAWQATVLSMESQKVGHD